MSSDVGSLDGLYVAEASEYMSRMTENVVDLTVTSPPYDDLRDYHGYEFCFEAIAEGLWKVTKPGGVVVWVVGDRIDEGRTLTSFRQALLFQELGFNVHDVMIYHKLNTPFMRSNAYTNTYELMLVLSKGKPATFNALTVSTVRHGQELMLHNKGSDGVNRKVLKELKPEKTRTNIWSYPVGFGGTTKDKIAFGHPAVFPERLAEDHILSWTNKGDLVFDPMCGSGTTPKMAEKHGRQWLGLDVSAEYVGIAQARVDSIGDRLFVP